MLNVEQLLSQVRCTKVCKGKSKVTSGDKYRIYLSHRDNHCSFIFNDNYNNSSSKRDIVFCLWLDADCYESVDDVYDFAREFCYNDINEAKKAYKECEKQSERLHRLFTDAEIEILSSIE